MNASNLEDRAAIHDLFTRYCCALDNGDVEAVVDCFTIDERDDHRKPGCRSRILLVLISKDGNHRSLPPGRYTCELVKEHSGHWRFSRHSSTRSPARSRR